MQNLSTSLGIPLSLENGYWKIELTHLRVFKGLSVLSRILGDMILDHVQNSVGDVAILYKLNPNVNPELVNMNISHIQVYARSGVLDNVLFFRDEFHDHLRSVFGTFQRPTWGVQLHPEFYASDQGTNPSKALLFPFHKVTEKEEIDYQFILERVNNKREKGKFILRLTIESVEEATLHLKNLPHIVVNDLHERFYFEGTSKLSEYVSEKISTAIKKNNFFIQEENLTQGHLFEQLHKTPLKKIEQIKITWDTRFANEFIHLENFEKNNYIKKLFLFLEDLSICKILERNEIIQVQIKQTKIFVYLSRLNRTLNFSINQEKSVKSLDFYLQRMPKLRETTLLNSNALSGCRVFLIHHITAEILGTIEAYRKLGASALHVMFVKYGGLVPDEYLDALLETQMSGLFLAGISKEKTSEGREFYGISRIYSEISNFKELYEFMSSKNWDFFQAMKFISAHFFLKFIKQAILEQEKVLLVEDGGYLAPLWNEYIANNKMLHDVFDEFLVEKGNIPDQKFGIWLKQVLIGSIEHTRNGYDRLKKIQNEKALFFPSFTIALSNQKVVEESKEVAHSILSAIESILHGQGFVLSRRKFLILGAAGNIGRFLCQYLENGRLLVESYPILKMDIAYKEKGYSHIEQIPKAELYKVDFIIGVVGHSILEEKFWEDFILNSNHSQIFIASGSTKTLEFSHLSLFLEHLMKEKKLNNLEISLQIQEIYDPQSHISQGKIVNIQSLDKTFSKKLYLLADLTPVNFLYYGVPTEMMDPILTQLVSLTFAMKRKHDLKELPHSGIFALDHQIDINGNFL